MGHDALLTVFIAIAAAAIALQAAALWGIYRVAEQIQKEIRQSRDNLREQFGPLAQSLTEILADSRQPLAAVTGNLAEASRVLRERVASIDSLAGELAERTRLEMSRVDQAITDVLEKVDTTTTLIQKSIVAPIAEISALVKGIRSGLGFLFSRRPASAARDTTSDDPMFI